MSEPIWRRRPDVLWRRSLDAVVLLAEDAEEPINLAATGPDVWELLAEPRTLDALVDVLVTMYDVDADVIRSDVAVTLDALVASGVLERVG
ncbi:MAG: hypothetical protein QOF40_691 [Actinomycetota bacterium]|nr:hypothetical protein [Actinomycetota bacterium]